MFTINIDEQEARKIIIDKVKELVVEVDAEYVLWDSNELKKRTCMSWNTIKDTFFFDPRFPKVKIGGKWYFPVRETREFLREWIFEHRE